jgi:ketosteroid isomerase-like protein
MLLSDHLVRTPMATPRASPIERRRYAPAAAATARRESTEQREAHVGTVREPSDWAAVSSIQQLVVTFCDAVSRGDWERFERLWAADGSWEESAPFEGRYEGAATIRARVEESMARVQLYVQTCHGTVVDVLDDRAASARTTIRGLSILDGRAIENHAIYYDQLVRLDEGWRFQRRFLQNLYVEARDLTGTIAIERAEIA